MNRVRQALLAADPVEREPELSAIEAQRIRRRVIVEARAAAGVSRRPRPVWLPLASLTIVVGLMVAWTFEGRAPLAHNSIPPPDARRGDGDTAFVLVPDAGTLPRFDYGELIRVEIPSPAGQVQADVLVGQDGFARAVRVVE